MPLSVEERETFLAEPHVAALSVESGEEGRGPVTVPIWYTYQPGGDVVVCTGRTSRKARLIADAGRFTLMVDRTAPSYRYVSVEGEVVSIATATEDQVREHGSRYLPTKEALEGYLRQVMAEPDAVVAITMRPRHWLTADVSAAS
ncbi:pyridoxamine 5'-phosphate oxidase family protein [Streptomyces sp. NPDC049577]|uniref:pyridoxamine 5'-phosphate oxidase family protein n=1 Tax=Streptomyces sp. NPDC049577 TaxID=3155153 RepID=UPI0034146704